MLSHLSITNFQCHESLDIEFSPGVTAITGPSDVGKSAVLRALRWVCLNQPQGDTHVRHGQPSCRVALTVDGHTIVRRRSSADNTYQLDHETYRAFTKDVPKPIASLLSISPQQFAGQHDSPYWLSETAGEVSRQLNAVVDLGIIDAVLDASLTEYNQAVAADREATAKLSEAKKASDSYSWVPDSVKDLGVLEGLDGICQRVTARHAALKALASDCTRSEALAGQKRLAAQAALGAAVAGRNAARTSIRWAELRILVAEITHFQSLKSPDTFALEEAFRKAVQTAKSRQLLAQAIVMATAAETTAKNCRTAATEAKKELDKATGDRCPVCGGPMKGI